MGKKTYLIFISVICIICVLCSCSVDNNIIDISEVINDKSSICLDCTYDVVDIVKLDTTPNSMLSADATMLAVTDSDYIIRSRDNVYRFDCTGKFQNLIGVYGKGASEHGRIMSSCCSEADRRVYILTMEQQVCVYSFDGKFIKKMKLLTEDKENIKSIKYDKKMGLVCEVRQYNNPGITMKLCTYKYDGSRNKEFVIYSDDYDFTIDRESYGNTYQCCDTIKCKLDFDDHIYSISDFKCSSVSLKSNDLLPTRDYVEDMSKKNELMMSKMQTLLMSETANYLYMIAAYNMKCRCVLIDKNKKEVVYSVEGNPKQNGGLNISLLPSVEFWPTYTSSDRIYSFIPTMSLMDAEMNLLHDYNIDQVSANDNPILLVLKENVERK